MIRVRTAKSDDRPDIQDVDTASTAALRQIYRPNQKALVNRVRISIHLHRLVATIDGRVVGTVQYYIAQHSVRVIGLGVHPEFHRRGVARALLHSLMEIGTREKASRLRLHTVKQTGNVDVFRRLGFKVVAEREDEYSESDRFEKLIDVEMEMELSQMRHSNSSS